MNVFSFLLFLVLVIVVISQSSGSALFTGLLLLLFCFFMFFSLSLMNLTWYGLLFFLMYVGGLLVLFFYVLSMKSNPGNMNTSSLGLISLGGFVFLFLFSSLYYSLDFSFRKSFEDQSYFLFNSKECFLMFVLGFFLLFVLFVVKKFLFDVKGAIRPMKF